MRENRTSGSEGGETGRPVFPTSILSRIVGSVDPTYILGSLQGRATRNHATTRRLVAADQLGLIAKGMPVPSQCIPMYIGRTRWAWTSTQF